MGGFCLRAFPGFKLETARQRKRKLRVTHLRSGRSIGGPQGVGEEGMQDVGEQQFLVLFLVIHAELDALERFVARFYVLDVLQQPLDALVDVCPIAQNFIDAGARKRGPEALLREGGEALVIAIEEPGEIFVEEAVAGKELTQNEGLKELGGVGWMVV